MSQQPDEQGLIRGYLLGELDEAGQERLEVLLLTDEAYVERVALAQDELVDEYVFGTLSEYDREQFEKNYLTAPERHQKLRIARALDKYLAAHAVTALARPEDAPRMWKARLLQFLNAYKLKLASALTVVVLVALGYGLWVFINNRWLEARLAAPPEQIVAVERELARLNEPEGDAFPPGRPLPNDAAVLSLKPFRLRDAGELRRVTIEGEAHILQLRLVLAADDYPNYRALVKTEDGKQFTVDGLHSRPVGDDKVVVLRLPAGILRTGDNEVRLFGLTPATQTREVGLYPFQVINRALP